METLESNGPRYNVDLTRLTKGGEDDSAPKKPNKKLSAKGRATDGAIAKNPINKLTKVSTITHYEPGPNAQ